MAYQKLGGLAKFRNPNNGEYEWGISPSGERIYVAGFCKCGQKCLLCESEFKEMMNNVGWEITRYTFWHFVEKKYGMKIPRIHISWNGEGERGLTGVQGREYNTNILIKK